MKILGIRIDNFSKKEALEKIEGFLSENKTRQIVTVNPEFIVGAQKDKKFKDIINNAELNLADGIGIKLAFWRFGKNLKKRMSGADLMWDILKIANERNMGVYLLANEEGLSSWEETVSAIRKVYPNMKFCGSNKNTSLSYFESEDMKKACNIKCCSVLFCNFGAPSQEKFIALLKKCDSSIKLAIGVGGAFDFITGKVERAPKCIRTFGFEWLWRLFLQPSRYKRIFRAIVIFPIRVILNK